MAYSIELKHCFQFDYIILTPQREKQDLVASLDYCRENSLRFRHLIEAVIKRQRHTMHRVLALNPKGSN